jgi:hypothetical protein
MGIINEERRMGKLIMAINDFSKAGLVFTQIWIARLLEKQYLGYHPTKQTTYQSRQN